MLRCLTLVIVLQLIISCSNNNLSDQPPNIVFINIDDMGWNDVSFMGSEYYETPNIDFLADNGMVFTQGYAAASNCAPSRASINTGKWTTRHQIYTVANSDRGESKHRKLIPIKNTTTLDKKFTVIAQKLKQSGYTTCHSGKWHLSENPLDYGFDINIAGAHNGAPASYYFPYGKNDHVNKVTLESDQGKYLTDIIMEKTLSFLDKVDKPFFLHYTPYAVHTPIQAKKELREHFQQKPLGDQKNPAYAAMIASVDQSVGRVLAELEAQGLRDNTLVLLTSDNGGLASVTNNAPLRGGKGNPYEGGIRVPLIARWPGIIPTDSVSSVPVSSIDIFPTLLDAAGLPIPEEPPVDGESLLGVMEGREKLTREGLFWHFPHYRGSDATPYSIVRSGNYKLIRYYDDGRLELYDLDNDLGEQHNLADANPERVKQLNVLLSKWLLGVGAQIPRPAPQRGDTTGVHPRGDYPGRKS